MPATLESCRPNPERYHERGYTLLELLVVLLLLSMATGLVVPAVQRQLAATEERALNRQVASVLGALPMQAFQQGQAMALDAKDLLARLPDLPADARIDLPAPLRYSATGVASGGRVELTLPGRPTKSWHITPVTGEIQRL